MMWGKGQEGISMAPEGAKMYKENELQNKADKFPYLPGLLCMCYVSFCECLVGPLLLGLSRGTARQDNQYWKSKEEAKKHSFEY